MKESTTVYFPFFTACGLITIFHRLLNKPKKFVIPEKKNDKRTVLMDPSEILLIENFSLVNFDWFFHRRKYVEEFLFNTAMLYEIIFITDNSLLNKNIYKSFDPYGCASYTVYCKNKKEISKASINREDKSFIILANRADEYNKELHDNILELNLTPKESFYTRSCNFFKNLFSPSTRNVEIADTRLLDLTDFLYSLQNSNTQDVRVVLKKFKHKNFFKTYEETRRKIFKLRNIFTSLKDFNDRKEEINKSRISFYENAKEKLNELKNNVKTN